MELQLAGKRVYVASANRVFDPSEPTVVFVHGAGMDQSVWAAQAPAVAEMGVNALSPLLPGHGRLASKLSSEGPVLTTIEAMADWLAQLLAELGIGSAILVGHSMGSLIALSLAARQPDRVRALALLGSAAAMPVHPKLLANAAKDLDAAIEQIVGWAHGPAHRQRPPGLNLGNVARSVLRGSQPGVLANDLAACNDFADGERSARSIVCPTLVISGKLDRMTPAKAGAALAQLIAKARFEPIAAAGHMVMVEQPRFVLRSLDIFVRDNIA
ncbi:MAG: alpha/beta fold hydrolase [Geminicoccaceae bacterium]